MSQPPGSKAGSLVQGLAIGGEFSAAITYVSELAAPKRRVFMTACLQVRVWADVWPACRVAVRTWYAHSATTARWPRTGPRFFRSSVPCQGRALVGPTHLPRLNPPCAVLFRSLVKSTANIGLLLALAVVMILQATVSPCGCLTGWLNAQCAQVLKCDIWRAHLALSKLRQEPTPHAPPPDTLSRMPSQLLRNPHPSLPQTTWR